MIVDSSAKVGLAAKRIVQAKFAMNTGQVCLTLPLHLPLPLPLHLTP